MVGLESQEARHVVAIGAQSMRRGTAFMRQRLQPAFAQGIGALRFLGRHYPLMLTPAFLASAMKAASPLSVKGWLSSFLNTSVGMVATSAPDSALSRT